MISPVPLLVVSRQHRVAAQELLASGWQQLFSALALPPHSLAVKMWQHYMSSKVNFGQHKQEQVKEEKLEPAKYLEPPGDHMEETIGRLNIGRVVCEYQVAVPFGAYSENIVRILAPAEPYLTDQTIRPLPPGRQLLHHEIEKAAESVRTQMASAVLELDMRSRAELYREAVESVKETAQQDVLYAIYDREEGAKRWLFDLSELIQAKDLLLLCALQRASIRPYVHNQAFQGRCWNTFQETLQEVSSAVHRCMAGGYFMDRGQPLWTMPDGISELPRAPPALGNAAEAMKEERRAEDNKGRLFKCEPKTTTSVQRRAEDEGATKKSTMASKLTVGEGKSVSPITVPNSSEQQLSP